MSFRFGELICYRRSTADHDGPIMFLAPCRHDSGSPGLIDILGLGPVFINHKDPTMWRRCWHFEDAARPGDIQVFVDGKDVTGSISVKGAEITIGVDLAYGQDIIVTRRVEL